MTIMPDSSRPIVIAHRGASGYLPEHTAEAKAYAYAAGADFLEQDVVLTRDDVPIVLHDIYLDGVTNVRERFPGRARGDGRFYAIDFLWEEIATLEVHERSDPATGVPAYPARFPLHASSRFRVSSLDQELELVRGLNRSTGRCVGIYPEIKRPAWHRAAGREISRIVVDLLHRQSYRDRASACFLQCFDPVELRLIREDLGCDLRLVQLIGDNSWREAECDYESLRMAEGLTEAARTVDGIGPWLPQVVAADGRSTSLVDVAHAAGLVVHPYTARRDDLPPWSTDFETLHRRLFRDVGVDGLFSDFPDLTAAWARAMSSRP